MNPKKIPLPLHEIRWTFSRSSGAGGQHVNKVSTRATLRWDLAQTEFISAEVRERFLHLWRSAISTAGELILNCEKFRSQQRNRDELLHRLRHMLEQAEKKPKIRIRTKVSKSAKERRLREKRRHAEKKSRRSGPVHY